MGKLKGVNLEIETNSQLDEISVVRRSNRVLAWRKKDIVAEVIDKLHRKEVK